MSVKTIFDALEAQIKVNTAFTGFNFFRFESVANCNKQSLGSVPFVKVAWKQNRSYLADNLYKLQSECKFLVEIRWISTKNDLDDIKRIEEYSLYDKAFKECVFSDDDAFLGLSSVLSFQADSQPVEIQGAAALKQCMLQYNCEIRYIETF